ncbi:unnamed protein product [Linum tenue]|uniref:Uncharacterized protein n=1 Tax=Linum tenue TaxID=586396 RepID=A0AAV0RUT9_9ROSI|nr:unnamed protein product [Linum tenue]
MALMLSSQTGAVLHAPPPHRHKSGRVAAATSLPFPQPLLPRLSLSHRIDAQKPRSSPVPTLPSPSDSQSALTGATRTVTTIVTLALSLTRLLVSKLALSVPGMAIGSGAAARSAGPLFFAALKDRPSGYLNTPLTVVAAGLAKWLDIYSGVLMVRVLLSWFPNIPWERQPLSAIRDLCDPYLNLFRNIIPPIFDTLDVSPLLAFAVLGTLGSILNSSRGMY